MTTTDKISLGMRIDEVVMKHPETAEVFFKHGMHCIGCMASRFETLGEGLKAHGLDPAEILKELNAAVEIEAKKRKSE